MYPKLVTTLRRSAKRKLTADEYAACCLGDDVVRQLLKVDKMRPADWPANAPIRDFQTKKYLRYGEKYAIYREAAARLVKLVAEHLRSSRKS